MIVTENIERAKREIKLGEKIIKAQSEEFNRKILEYGKFKILVFPELIGVFKKDSQRQLDSGLNHVLAKIASKNEVAIGFDLEEIRKMQKEQKAITLARLRQNIKVCRKANTKIILLNVKDKRDALSFFISMGASTKQAKEATG